jgi:hypothetical protein
MLSQNKFKIVSSKIGEVWKELKKGGRGGEKEVEGLGKGCPVRFYPGQRLGDSASSKYFLKARCLIFFVSKYHTSSSNGLEMATI